MSFINMICIKHWILMGGKIPNYKSGFVHKATHSESKDTGKVLNRTYQNVRHFVSVFRNGIWKRLEIFSIKPTNKSSLISKRLLLVNSWFKSIWKKHDTCLSTWIFRWFECVEKTLIMLENYSLWTLIWLLNSGNFHCGC